MDESETQIRLHKFLARAGVASRRTCEQWIADGRVQVNGKTIRTQGVTVDPETDNVRFDGETVHLEPPAYYLVYKPKGVVCTTNDQFGRRSVVDIVRDSRGRRLFPVGRLEEDSEGLILVTNDGNFTNRIARRGHPLRHSYFVRLRGRLSQEQLDKVRNGVWLSDGRSGPMHVKVLRMGKKVSTVIASPMADQHRLLRRVFAKAEVMPDKVVRTRFGPLTTDSLSKGGYRRLTAEEIKLLLDPPPEARLDRSKVVRRSAPPTVIAKQKRARKRRARLDERNAARPNRRGGKKKSKSRSAAPDSTGPKRRFVGP